MPTTEIAILPLIAGSNPGDPDDRSSAVLRDSFHTMSQQDGLQQIHFGTWVESPDSLQLFINWENIGKHNAFKERDTYGPFRKHFGTALSGKPNVFHVDFKSSDALDIALSAPVTEIFTVYYDGSDVPPASIDGIVDFFTRTKAAAPPGLADCTFGTTYEEVTHQDATGKAIVGVIGWSSVQAHKDFRETQAFKDARPSLIIGMKRIEMHHVAMLDYVP